MTFPLSCLVEANLCGVAVNQLNKRVDIIFMLAGTGEQVEMVAEGVEDVLVQELRSSNIVDRVRLLSDGEDGEGIESALFHLLRGDPQNNADMSWPPLVALAKRVRSGELALLEVEPVYGASVLICAKTVTFTRKSTY